MVCLCYAPFCASKRSMYVCVCASAPRSDCVPSIAQYEYAVLTKFTFSTIKLCVRLTLSLCSRSAGVLHHISVFIAHTHTQSHIYMACERVQIIITFNFWKVFFLLVEILVVASMMPNAIGLPFQWLPPSSMNHEFMRIMLILIL